VETTDAEEEIEGLPRGHLAAFVESLTPAQKKMWRPIRRVWKKDKQAAEECSGRRGKARSASMSSDANRDLLYEAVSQAQGKITPEKIERLIDNAVDKGDVQALRVMAQMAGMDLTDRPKQAVGDGAKLIIIRPHPMLLTPEEEASVQTQIVAAEGPK